MKRSIFCLLLIVLLSGCSSAPRTVLTLESEPAEGSPQLAGELLPAHAMGERPHPDAVWVPGQYWLVDGRHVWVPGHWGDTAVAR